MLLQIAVMRDAKYGSLPFDAQIAFFRKKLALPTRGWTDIWQSNHDHAFVVAGATKMALLEDMQAAVQKAIEHGTTLAEFRKDFDKSVAKHGWAYNGERGWRTRVIYETNLRTSYAAGRHEQLQKLEYWQYHHSIGVNNPREQHLAWDGLVLSKDDSFWNTHYPPNGWGCRCYVTGMSKTRMKQKGLSPAISPDIPMRKVLVGNNTLNPRTVDVPEGVSPGFAYAPGRSAWIHHHVPPSASSAPHGFEKALPANSAGDLMPSPREFEKNKLLPVMQAGQEEGYVRAFLKPFGADIGKHAIYTDATGEAVVVSESLFKKHDGSWKIGKRSRSQEIVMLAETIKDPDEIWTRMVWHNKQGKAITERIYISRYTVGDEDYTSLVVMDYRNGWHGITAHASLSVDELNQKIEKNRVGVRLYKREP